MFSKRANMFVYICVALFILLVARLSYIVIQNGRTYETMARKQQIREITVKNIRADIYDRNGVKLTDVATEKLYLTQKGTLSHKKIDSRFEINTKKRNSGMANHLIGYTSPDGRGVCGIESEFDFVLKTKGKVQLSYMADATDSPLGSYRLTTDKHETKAGVNLTIDARIQEVTLSVMKEHIKKGAAVVLDCKNFDVLAMVSLPDYDASAIESYKDSKNGEFLNRAVLGYNAGSVFKIVTASAALEKNPLYIQRGFDCRGSYVLPDGSVFCCHKKDGHGMVSFNDAFALSCNCSYYLTASEVGGTDIINKAKDFGMGSELLNVNLQENPGNLPIKNEYTNGDVLNISIGQGEILVSPLQCAVMAATVANGGIRRDVNIVAGYTDDEGTAYDLKKTMSYKVTEPQTASEISQMMRKCVLEGTAKSAADATANIAGKTGSAETGWIENGTQLVHGWFAGFFPFENPRYAAVVFSEGGRSGAGSCVEPFVRIAEKINEIYPFKQ